VASQSAELDELLRTREAQGLRVPLWGRILVLGYGLLNVAASVGFTEAPGDTSPTVAALVIATLIVTLAVNLKLLALLRRRERVSLVGWVGAGMDALFVVALSVLAQLAGAEDGLTPGYVLKTEMPVTVLAVVAVNGLALRPRYPLVVGAGALVALLLPAVRLLWAPEAALSSHRPDVYAGAALDPGGLVTIVVMAAILVAGVAWAAHVGRQTVLKAIDRELAHAALQQDQLRLVMREKVKAIGKLVAGVSHEINTPVGALKSGVDTQRRVLERVAGDLSTQRVLQIGHQSLDAMSAAADRIRNLEVSLRGLAHLDEADFRKVDLRRELDSVVSAVHREHATTPIEVAPSDLPEVYLSASEFNQALLSLLRTAVAAAGPEGKVTVHLEKRHGTVRLAIADNGPALAPEALASLFDIGFDGSGERVSADLGLATAQSVVQRHGGELKVESVVGVGTTYTIEIPFDAVDPDSMG